MTNNTDIVMQSAFCVECNHSVYIVADESKSEDEVRCIDHAKLDSETED